MVTRNHEFRVRVGGLLAAALLLTLNCGLARAQTTASLSMDGPDLDELIRLTRSRTVFHSLSDRQLRERAARGIVAVLDETLSRPPYGARGTPFGFAGPAGSEGPDVNVFFGPREADLLRQEVAGQFGGIGARIMLRAAAPGQSVVTAEAPYVELLEPLPGSVALRAGLQKGDRISGVDGKPIAGKNLAEVVGLLRGPAGSTVKLTVLRPPAAPFEVALVRETVRVPSVELGQMPGNVGHLRVSGLNGQTGPELRTALDKARVASMRGLVLDLRGCPGGQLEVAVDVASAFLPRGTAVVTLQRAAGAEQALVTTAAPVYEGPLVVLVDHATASGAEILAGAIQTQRRGLVAGEATYGKQTAETIFGLKGGYAAKLSTAFFRRPGSPADGGSGFPVRPDVHLAAPMAMAMARSQAQLASTGQVAANADLVLQAAAALLVWRFGDGGRPR